MMKTKNKYGNKKVAAPNGEQFDSKKEMRRYALLKVREAHGDIKNLERQVKYTIIPSQRDEKTGKVVTRAITYTADFVYIDRQTGELVIEDVKGFKTEVYKLKKKLMYWKYRILIHEV